MLPADRIDFGLFNRSAILTVNFIHSFSTEKDDMDDLIQVVINVLQIADELLMDRLKEICEKVLGEQGATILCLLSLQTANYKEQTINAIVELS
jgi:hypothetical protein